MKIRPYLISLVILIVVATTLLALSNRWLIYRFQGGPADGYRPWANLVSDNKGNLYSTTLAGGNGPPACYSFHGKGCGTVFELVRPSSPGSSWTEQAIYSFQEGSDGSGPLYGLVFDQSGNLYGTTSNAVFKLTPPQSNSDDWTETTIYNFKGGTDGSDVMGNLVFDKVGHLYGTTFFGGNSYGTVFELSPPPTPDGSWTEAVIYSFTGREDGEYPESGLVIDSNGILYGTTNAGGHYLTCGVGFGCGVVFRLAPPSESGGSWKEQTIYAFGGASDDGRNPDDSLVFDAAGNLYGTTPVGGKHKCGTGTRCGTVFELSPPASGNSVWTETILYNFASGNDGAFPPANLIFGSDGALYGTTSGGGGHTANGACPDGCGTVFKLIPPVVTGGEWTEQILHRFGSQMNDAISPRAALLQLGNSFYSTTEYGGGVTQNCSIGCGTVFSFTLPSPSR